MHNGAKKREKTQFLGGLLVDFFSTDFSPPKHALNCTQWLCIAGS